MQKISKKALYLYRAVRYIGTTVVCIALLFIFLFSTWETVDLLQAIFALVLLLIGCFLNVAGLALESRLHKCPNCGNLLMRLRYGDGRYAFRYRATLPKHCEDCGWQVQFEYE